MSNKVLLTGIRTTGKLHFGHYVGVIKNLLGLQEEEDFDNKFLMLADIQALTDNFDKPDKVRTSIPEVLIDCLACGIDPDKINIFVQSDVHHIPKLTLILMNLISVAHLKRNPVVKDLVEEEGEKVNVGFLSYPVSQAADILFCGGNVVPVGSDQLPILEDVNDLVRRFNRIYGDVFDIVKPILSEQPSLPGIYGKYKASKSKGNAIYISDDEDTVREKVMQMYTDPDHIRVEDPGKVEGNVVFAYLDVFDDDKAELEDLKNRYSSGGVGDVEIKKRLIEVLNSRFGEIRRRRAELEKNRGYLLEVLQRGREVAIEAGNGVMRKVEGHVGIGSGVLEE